MLISVVVTTYNYARFLPACLDSLLAQDFPTENFEILVIDDCSTDDTVDVLQAYAKHPNLRVIVNSTNLGGAGNANKGIELATGDYFVRVDADDHVHPHMLRCLYEKLNAHAEAMSCSSDYQLVDMENQILQAGSARSKPIACGLMHRRREFLELGGYNSAFLCMEEEERQQRLGRDYRTVHTDQALYYYRQHGSNKTVNLESMAFYRQKLAAGASA